MQGQSRRFAALLVGAVIAFTTANVAVASPGEEAEFVALINQSRQAAGLAPLTVYDDLVDDARRHTAEMVARGDIFHSTNSQLAAATTGWSLLGENVGMGPNPSILHSAFMNSPSHRANILGDFHRVGVGAERAPDGTLFVTVVFMQLPSPSPPSTTTTTTVPPPTTTTTPPAPATTTSTAPEVERSLPPVAARSEVAVPVAPQRRPAVSPPVLALEPSLTRTLSAGVGGGHPGICVRLKADGPILIV